MTNGIPRITRLAIAPLFLLLTLISVTGHALPFTIVPKDGTQLPSTVYIGSPVTAYYTVTNNTQAQRNNNYTKWLPQNVTQVTSGGDFMDTCGSTFNLAPVGQSGDSCTLQLSISGPVNGNATSPHNHLFVCFPGGKTCAGTNFPLNVTAIPTYLYATNASTNSVLQCPLKTDGTLGNCINAGNPGVTLNSPTGITLNNTGTLAYIANGLFSSPPNTVSVCTIGSDGRVSNCENSGSNLFENPSSVTLNPAGTIAYVTNTEISANPLISLCSILPDGSFDTCTDASGGTSIDNPFGIAFTSDGTQAYVTNVDSGNVLLCDVNPDGTLTSCADMDYNCSGQPGTQPYGIALSLDETIAYIVDGSLPSLILACPIDGDFDTCVSVADGLTTDYFTNGTLTLNSSGTIAYIAGAENSNLVYSCPIIDEGLAFDVPNCTTISGAGHVYGVALSNIFGPI